MRIDVLTLFPDLIGPYLNASIMSKAIANGLLQVEIHNIRDYAPGRHKVTDEAPYGGGGGMVMKPGPIFAAAEAILTPSEPMNSDNTGEDVRRMGPPIILMTPQGRPFTQKIAFDLAQHDALILICGRYEGVDERVRQHLATDEISIGDFVLTGGEIPALILIDAVARLIPGVLGAPQAAKSDSYATGLLEGPHYTRPENFRDWNVPPVLLSGHAAEIARWRRQQSLRRTWNRRPELLEDAILDEEDKYYLASLADEESDDWD